MKLGRKKRNYVLFHGYGETPDKAWLPWLHRELEERGHQVWAPVLPDPIRPSLARWLKTTSRRAATWDENTVVIGHSLGGILALRLLEKACPKPVRGVVLVGVPYASMVNFSWLTHFFDQPIDWKKLRQQAKRFVAVQAKNDPLVPFDHILRYEESLSAKVILTERGGHFTARRAAIILDEVLRV